MAPPERNHNKAIAWVPVIILWLPSMASAQNVTNWATWVIPTEYPLTTSGIRYAAGTTGTVVDPQNGQEIGLSLSGEILSTSSPSFSWPDYSPTKTRFISEESPTSPLGKSMVGGSGLTTDEYKAHALRFGDDVTNAVMGIWSLGRSALTGELTFSQPFRVLSGNITGGGDETSGYTLRGNEGAGVIQFLGTYDRIDWVITGVECWHGVSVGLTIPDNPQAGEDVAVYNLFAELVW